jgi:para-nitrobenzyl esterase
LKKKFVFCLAVILCLVLPIQLMGCAGSENAAEKAGKTLENAEGVPCQNGNMIGTMENGVASYKGIPYAKTPTGDLRWKAPEAPSDSDEDFDASDYGDSAIQTEWFSEKASYREQSEDCLTLNVWTSSPNTDAKKPVMVFFHGGAYGWGGTGDPLYDGQNFTEAHDDVILVTANYRLGIMGFIDFSAVEGGEAYSDAPNLGLRDQILALQWIKENIEQFGGDPDNVTIFGESAGGGTTSLLMITDEAKELFKRCISESGSVALTYSKEDCRNQTEVLMELAGAKNMQDLLALSEDRLKELNATVINEDGYTLNDLVNMPQRDGKLLPGTLEGVYQAFSEEPAMSKDLLIGTNKNEWNYWIGEMAVGDAEENYLAFKSWMESRFAQDTSEMDESGRETVDDFLTLQSDKEEPWKTVELYNDLAFRVPACIEAANHADAGGNSYMYYWTYPSAIERYGACHAVELSYVFNNLEDTDFTGEDPSEELAVKIQEAWVNFAKTGDPSISGIKWPKYTGDRRETMIIGKDWTVLKDPLAEQRILGESLIKYDIK